MYIYHIDFQWNEELKMRQHGVFLQPCLLKNHRYAESNMKAKRKRNNM